MDWQETRGGNGTQRGRGRGHRGNSDRGRGDTAAGSMRGSRGGGGQQHGRGSVRQGEGGNWHDGGERGNHANGSDQSLHHDTTARAVVDLGIQAKENELLSANASLTPRLSLPARPGYGTRGTQSLVWANYFRLDSPRWPSLNRYRINIAGGPPDKKLPNRVTKRIIELFLQSLNLGHSVVTDFAATLFTLRKLTLRHEGWRIEFYEAEEKSPSRDAKQYTVHLDDPGVISTGDLLDDLTSSHLSSLVGERQDMVQALNVLLGHRVKADYSVVSLSNNRHFKVTDKSQKGSLGDGLEVVRGFFLSVRAATSRLLVNVQVKNMAFYEARWLVDVWNTFLGYQSDRDKSIFLSKLKVEVHHLEKVVAGERIPRIKTIHALAQKDDGKKLEYPPKVPRSGAGPAEVQFYLTNTSAMQIQGAHGKKMAGGSWITVKEFFRQKHGQVVDNRYPVVNVGTADAPSYLPLELCRIQIGQPARASLSPDQTSRMQKFAVRRPHMNQASIKTTGLELLKLTETNETLREFGISVSVEMTIVPARRLHGPKLKYGQAKTKDPKNASWNMMDLKFVQPKSLGAWGCLYIVLTDKPLTEPEQWSPKPQSKEFYNGRLGEFAKGLKSTGMQCSPPMETVYIAVHKGDEVNGIDAAFRKIAGRGPANALRFMVVIIPDGDPTALYNKVKFAGDVKWGIHTVCMKESKFGKPDGDRRRQLNVDGFANIAHKINLKLGGCNHAIDRSQLGIIGRGETMLMGIDVTHPSPGSESDAPSVASIVASVDGDLAQWPAELSVQEAKQEMVAGLSNLVIGRLRTWQGRNSGKLPRNILVYRDGVSEGQYQIVLDKELVAIKQACESLYKPTDHPRISIIIVGKRHHTRFYVHQEDEGDKSGNPHNGLVVDRGVTDVSNWDFFLQAHTALQGTARPAHYVVIHDEIFRDIKASPSSNPKSLTFPNNTSVAPVKNAADDLEDLTHKLCYLFGRATKAVSVCPPAYYADLACERARCYLANKFDPGAGAGFSASNVEDYGEVSRGKNLAALPIRQATMSAPNPPPATPDISIDVSKKVPGGGSAWASASVGKAANPWSKVGAGSENSPVYPVKNSVEYPSIQGISKVSTLPVKATKAAPVITNKSRESPLDSASSGRAQPAAVVENVKGKIGEKRPDRTVNPEHVKIHNLLKNTMFYI